MTDKIANGLKQLGFFSGWVITGDEITLWEHDEEQPTPEAIANAAEQWAITQEAEAEAKAAQRAALLDRLGLTEDEARLLLGGN
jgi:hypothetical protein